MSNHEECNCEQSLRLKREVEELKAELASTTTTLVVARSELRCPICLGLPFDDHTGMGCACGADGTTKSGGIVEAFRSVHEAWAHEKVRADAAIDRGNALNAANAALRAEWHARNTAKYEGVWIWDRNYNDLASMSDKMVISITAGSLRALIATQGGKGEPVARCEVCDWPLRERKEDGCVKGNCSFRPDVGSDDHKRLQKRRAELDAAKAPAVAPPTVDESEPPEGWSLITTAPHTLWRGVNSRKPTQGTTDYTSRPEAVAACWAHSRRDEK